MQVIIISWIQLYNQNESGMSNQTSLLLQAQC